MPKNRERKRVDKYDYTVIKTHRNYVTGEHRRIRTTLPISEFEKLKRNERN